MAVISNIVQVIISLILVLILAFIGYAVFNNESASALKNYNNVKKETNVFKGVFDFSTIQGIYDTQDKSLSSYVDLKPSINQAGGAEYTYNFWLYRDSDKLNNLPITAEDIGLILRGSKKNIHYNSDSTCLLKNINDKYILVKNPLIRMKKDGTSIIVEYNTITFPDAFHEGGKTEIGVECSGGWFDRNKGLLGIYNIDSTYDKKWFMVTVILQEISPNNDILYKNKTTCKMYINGILMLDRIVESPYDALATSSAAMRHNKGPLYINPRGIYGKKQDGTSTTTDDTITDPNALMMADLTYFNYAVGPEEIETLYKKGFTKGSATIPSVSTNDPALYNLSAALKDGPKPF
jgi:hypothetical protein